jgi:hypothetical protein
MGVKKSGEDKFCCQLYSLLFNSYVLGFLLKDVLNPLSFSCEGPESLIALENRF